MNNRINPIHIIGGGLAGTEAAWQIAQQNIPVILHEMRPHQKTAAHQTDHLAELVCSNSFRSDDAENNAVGMLHAEMRLLNSVVMAAAEVAKVPAGSALAVDRDVFSAEVTKHLEAHPMITIAREEITEIPLTEWDNIIIATGPLTSDALSTSILALTGEDKLAFFDAIAPIVYKESIDFNIAWFQSRYDKGEGADYINLPMTEEQYTTFIHDLNAADKTTFKEWEENTPYFDGCMPIEVMAERGPETLRFGPMKPVGLTNPNTGKAAHAVVQLRQDNKLGTLYNMVGFQTKMKYGEQTRIFKKIPGLENAEFARLGGLHRNTFINSPKLLDETLALKETPHVRFAGQITGVEGYVESAAMGLLAGRHAAAAQLGTSIDNPPITTAFGGLIHHITGGADAGSFQPMNINFGLLPDLTEKYHLVEVNGKQKRKKLKKADRKQAKAARGRQDFSTWLETL